MKPNRIKIINFKENQKIHQLIQIIFHNNLKINLIN